jgi:hypothetical protein
MRHWRIDWRTTQLALVTQYSLRNELAMPFEHKILVPPKAGELNALEAFVVDNDDLLALESIIGRFNIFDALGIARTEIRHSNFLAFIRVAGPIWSALTPTT